MRLTPDAARQNNSPEYRQALQELIKYEIQALIERLSATGEEAFILTASIRDGTSTQLGSQKGEGFLLKQSDLSQSFLSFCSEDGINSSADELGIYGNDNSRVPQEGDKPVVSPSTYTSLRSRDRVSITEDRPAGSLYEVTPASVIFASERNDSVSSVSSFVAATQEDENDLQCKICSRSFRSYTTLRQHVRLHMAKSYKCGVCGKIFSVKKRYQRHIKSHNNYKMLECGICDKSFLDQYSWKRHRELHLEDRNFSCNLCGKAFFEKYSLRVHQTGHFSSPSKADKTTDSSAGYSCHICQKISKTKTAMKTHLLTHSAKKHVCEFCNKRFSLRYSYVRHRRIHTGEKPYKCGSCDKSFSDGSAWAKHVRTHSGIKPYSCSTCSKSFFDKTTCKTHMKSHQNKRQIRLADQERRNFEEVSTDKTSPILPKKKESKAAKLTFELSDSESRLFASEDLDLAMEGNDDKEFDDAGLLQQGLGTNTGHELNNDVTEEKEGLGPLLDSVQLDDMFQKDFVERNMPSKAIESDNEFITANFPDILADETENENQTEIEKDFGLREQNLHESKEFLESSPQKHLPKVPYRSRRTIKEKLFLDSPVSKCKKCHKTFKSEILLKQHKQFKCMMKLYKCRYCGKQLSTKNSLVRHERIHVGNRPYQCHICQKSFADNYGCIRHIKHHFSKDNKSSVRTLTIHENLSEPALTTHTLVSEEEKDDVVESTPASEQTYTKTSPSSQKSPVHKMSPGYRAEPASINMSPGYRTEPASINMSPGYRTEPASINMSPGYRTEPANISMSPGYRAEPASINMSPGYRTEPASINMSPGYRTEPANISMSPGYRTEPASINMSPGYRAEPASLLSPVLPKSDTSIGASYSENVYTGDNVVLPNTSSTPAKESSIGVDNKTHHLFKCSLCAALFSSHELCVEHVQQHCALTSKPSELPTQPTYLPTTTTSNELNNLFQCSLCLNMFTEESVCQDHIDSGCMKMLPDKDDTKSAVDSILHERLSFSDISTTGICNALSQQQFSDLSTSDNFTDIPSGQVVLLSDSYPANVVASVKETPETTDNPSGTHSTPAPQPTSTYIKLTPQPALCHINTKPVEGVNPDEKFTGGVQKPVMSLGLATTSKFLVTNKGLSLVGPSVLKTVAKSEKKKDKKGGADISERTCTICDNVFTTKHILKQHTLIHMEKKFGCKFCMKKFHNKYGRDRHERIHTGEKPFSCPNCKKAFSDNSTYRKHTRVCCGVK